MRELVLVHGRAQEHKDAAALKQEWLDTLDELPISRDRVRFPYYGNTLFDLVAGVSPEDAEKVVVKGPAGEIDPGMQAFVAAVLAEVIAEKGITDAQVLAAAAAQGVDTTAIEKGPLNWGWVRSILKAIDTYVPHGSGTSIATFTRDVYLYITNDGLRHVINEGVRAAFTPDVESVVVGHSLGTVVSYRLLRDEGKSRGWRVPLYVTVGSPLGVTAIKDSLKPRKHPECVTHWFNAMDPDDVVALYPLDDDHFRVDPAIENKTDVENQTDNQHGIRGYLNDKEVARRIHDVLSA
jgi:hypothetical protein